MVILLFQISHSNPTSCLKVIKVKVSWVKREYHSLKTREIKEIKDASKEQREDTQSLKKYSNYSFARWTCRDGSIIYQAVSSHGALVNSSLAIVAGKALIQKYPNAVGNIDIDSSSWTNSLFKRMGYVRWMKTSSKVKIPDGARREIDHNQKA